ncbi:g11085 [Coccomyxa elongata]
MQKGKACAAIILLALACTVSGRALQSLKPLLHEENTLTSASPNVRIDVDLSQTHPVAPNLYGIFFEEIQHAGEGGIYAELIQDRTFSGLAYTQAFLDSDAQELVLGPSAFEGPTLSLHPLHEEASHPFSRNTTLYGATSLAEQLRQHAQNGGLGATSQPVSWRPLGSTTLTLTKQYSMTGNGARSLSMRLAPAQGAPGGIINTGFWGIPVQAGHQYELSAYLRDPSSDAEALLSIEVALESSQGSHTYATAVLEDVGCSWANFRATLTANTTDPNARLALRLKGGEVLVNMVSLFPAENGVEGSVSPFRSDLLDLMKGLQPRFLRFPGGCYVEGVRMRNGFFWKPSVGPVAERPGHWNGMWQYWSTDGLGLYEYMVLTEELGAEPIWVINNGLSHEESMPTAHIGPLVADALDSIEFITGATDTPWGSLRASMGHPEPWDLTYIGIGNEDCGKPYYVTNYLAFFHAIKEHYPHMQLIANCNMGSDAPTEMWDWHWYTDPQSMFNGRYTFDSMTVAKDSYVFASEYAVFDWGISTIPRGNIQGAVAEAAFMTGMERNSEVVQLAAYAPLLANINHQGALCPTNLIIYDNHRAFANPSYHVQALFAQHQGVAYAHTSVNSRSPRDNGVAASVTCQDTACASLSIKLVNYAAFPQTVSLNVSNATAGIGKRADVTVLTGSGPYATNSFDLPFEVAPKTSELLGMSPETQLELPAFSVTIIATSSDDSSAAAAA